MAARQTVRPKSFADQLNRLFDSIYPPGRDAYTSMELVEWAAGRGLRLSAPYLSQLRTGARSRPSDSTVELIASFFGIESEYFTDPESRYREALDAELDWLELAHNPDVRRLTSMLADLPAAARDQLMSAVGI